ncbi:DUF4129 domain-containing protein [Kutzneria buriramensis]|uniref:Uncharacterized protein DUF4129 n=1 Tax=Kutzneria buriramensis TaxID=1045776 RepID=A0A3E0HZ53_9PSEU|nr:DUF4129 domain-containing protein [Kutzneria buriramensis]REH51590.1 uncharacterized protein DUF4129 [Kutzneria buriramensis]
MSRVSPRVLALAALLLLAVVAARGATSFTLDPLRLTGRAQNQILQTNQDQLRGNAATNPIPYVSLLLTVTGLLLTVAAVISLLAMIARRKRVRITAVPGREETAEGGAYGSLAPLVRAGRQALARLRAHEGGPPSDRVIAAWLSLEHAAMETGTERQPHETPTEFVGSVLAGHEVNREALDRLRRLYGRARFGVEGVMTEADAEAAGDALDRIITDLEAVR